MKKCLAIISVMFSLSAMCMDHMTVTMLDTGKTLCIACNATLVNFSLGHGLYYPVLEAQECLFEKIVEKARSISVDYSKCTDTSEEKLVSGNLSNLGLLVYAMYKKKSRPFELPTFIYQALKTKELPSLDDLPEGGVLVFTDGSVFCNRRQFEWVKQQTQ